MLYTPSYGNSQLKMEILEFTSKEAVAPLMSLAAPLWYWKFWKKILDFGNFFPKFWKIWKFWFEISKVGGKFWRWEGYITMKRQGAQVYHSTGGFTSLYCLQALYASLKFLRNKTKNRCFGLKTPFLYDFGREGWVFTAVGTSQFLPWECNRVRLGVSNVAI